MNFYYLKTRRACLSSVDWSRRSSKIAAQRSVLSLLPRTPVRAIFRSITELSPMLTVPISFGPNSVQPLPSLNSDIGLLVFGPRCIGSWFLQSGLGQPTFSQRFSLNSWFLISADSDMVSSKIMGVLRLRFHTIKFVIWPHWTQKDF